MSQDTGYICLSCGRPATQVVGDLEPVCQNWPECNHYERIIESLAQLSNAIKEQLAPVVEVLVREVAMVTRELFYLRLIEVGLPTPVARIVSTYCPERFLPVGWIYKITQRNL